VSVSDRLQALDQRQQRSPRLGFVVAVVKKFDEDQAGQLAALISYYAFVSLFPLLLVFVTILGFILQGNPSQKQKILEGTLGQVPLISDQLRLHSIGGSGAALAVGIVLSLLAGLGITNASQNAFNRVWNVPFKRRPDFMRARLRGLVMLAILGALSIVATVAGGFVGSVGHPALAVVGAIIVALVFNLALFMTAFKLLTATELTRRELWPGVIVASLSWQLLQHLGGYYIERTLTRTQPLYGVFAIVLGLLAWLYLGAQLTLFSAEINVVRAQRLWPRSFFGGELLDADKRALRASAEVEERVESEEIDVDFVDRA